jgi:hypothetical protein
MDKSSNKRTVRPFFLLFCVVISIPTTFIIVNLFGLNTVSQDYRANINIDIYREINIVEVRRVRNSADYNGYVVKEIKDVQRVKRLQEWLFFNQTGWCFSCMIPNRGSVALFVYSDEELIETIYLNLEQNLITIDGSAKKWWTKYLNADDIIYFSSLINT